LNKYLQLRINFLFESELTELTNLVHGVPVDSLLNVLLSLLWPGVHLVDTFAVGLSPRQEKLVDHLLADLCSQNLIDLLIVEESYLPVFMAKVFREVLKVCRFIPLDVLKCDQLAFLVIREFVNKNFAEDLIDGWAILEGFKTWASSRQSFAKTFVVDDIDEIDDQISQRQSKHSVDSLVLFWAWVTRILWLRSDFCVRVNQELDIVVVQLDWALLLNVCRMYLVKQESKTESYDVWKFLLYLLAVDLVLVVLLGILILCLAKDHDITDKLFKAAKPLVYDFFVVSFDQSCAEHVQDWVYEAMLLLGLQFLSLVQLLLVACKLVWSRLALKRQFDIL
jgi:hypothetical protein